jgi:putative NADH-flavin reductase
LELVNRGHQVTGLARNPSKLGEHPLYTPKSFDVVDSAFLDLVEVLKGYDVVVK